MATKKKTQKQPDVKASKAEFSLDAPQAKRVFLSGDFNKWSTSSHPLKKDREGRWRILVDLDPGQHQYRFFVDGEWQNDPDCRSFADNPFGTRNCLKIVG